MINQVVPDSVRNRTFIDFSQPQNGWYLSAHPSEEVKKKEHKYGKTVALSALVAGFGILALMKGSLPKTAAKYLEKLCFNMEKKLAKGGRFQNFYRYSIGKINTIIEKSESINNFTTIKDVLFQKLMFGKDGKWTFTRKIHEGITALFNKMSRKTVNSSYAKTQKKFANLNEYLLEVNQKLLRDHPNDSKYTTAVNEINARISRVNEGLNRGFGINARNERLEKMEKATDGLFDYFWNTSVDDIRSFKPKHMFNSYIAEDIMMPFKMKTANEVSALRQVVTHDIIDNYKATNKALDNIQKFINPSDASSSEILTNLRENLRRYKKLSGNKEAEQRLALNKEIVENLKKLSSTFKKEASAQGYTSDAVSSISKYVEEVEEIISKGAKKGEMQEILTAYKPLLSRKEYLKLKAKMNSAVKSLDESIEIETVKYVDKARDLKLGSAPTDVLSILGAAGAVGWFLGKAKDKDERISASLKYGIPAIGAIATSLYCTARLVSGGKAMAFGLLSGWIMNKAGVIVDDTRKKYSLDVSLQNKTVVKPQPDNV